MTRGQIVLLVVAALVGVAAIVAGALRDAAVLAGRGAFLSSTGGDRAVLWAVGDGADGGAKAKSVAARIATGRVDRLLYLGDVYGTGAPDGDGDADDYLEHYVTVYGGFVGRTSPTPGNHEWPQRTEGYEAFWSSRTKPMPAYYAFDTAGWRVLSLNSKAPHGPGSPQLRWLTRELERPGTCRLAFWHRPRFSAGRHGDQKDVAPLWDALRGRATIVVNGHDHNMQRLHPIDGITELVSGAGGHGLYEVKRDPRVAFGSDDVYGALRMTLTHGRADLAFVAADGGVLDRHRVTCRPVA